MDRAFLALRQTPIRRQEYKEQLMKTNIMKLKLRGGLRRSLRIFILIELFLAFLVRGPGCQVPGAGCRVTGDGCRAPGPPRASELSPFGVLI
jgi:hypothetical protein